jgi:HPt (histidine-containing phosphotransfer) domain-containing protein
LTLVERLAAVPGFDVNFMLHHLGGQVAALQRVLERFVQTYGGASPSLQAAPGAGETDAWRQASHALRGACGAVGATVLLKQLSAFEEQAAAGADLGTLQAEAGRLNEAVSRLVAGLRAALQA